MNALLEELEGTLVPTSPTSPASALEQLNRSEIDIQIATAKRYPRQLSAFKKTALAMATLDEETAGDCFYALKRDGKTIDGPSIRLAEIICSAWKNIRYGARIISIDDKYVTAQGVCHDLENNVAHQVEVMRRITNKEGRRYSDDMITVTSNAACSIAARNAVFKVVPFAYVKSIYKEAKRVSIGDVKTLDKKRQDMIAYFGKMGVSEKQILSAVGRAEVVDLAIDDLATLKGFANAIKEHEITIEEVFPPVQAVDELKEKLANRAKASEPVKPIVFGGPEPTPEPPSTQPPPQPAKTQPASRQRRPETKQEFDTELMELQKFICDHIRENQYGEAEIKQITTLDGKWMIDPAEIQKCKDKGWLKHIWDVCRKSEIGPGDGLDI